MDKDIFFTQVHKELSKQYNTSTLIIKNIRSVLLGENLTVKQYSNRLRNEIKTLRIGDDAIPHRIRKLNRRLLVLKFLTRETDKVPFLLVKTKYDRV